MLSAAVLLPVALGCLWAGGWWFVALSAVLTAGVAMEWVAMCGYSFMAFPGNLLGFSMGMAVLLTGLGRPPSEVGAGLAAVAPLVVLLVFFAKIRPTLLGGVAGAARFSPGWLAFGFLYIGPAAIALPWLRADPAVGFANTLFMLTIVWSSDIGAYAVGRLVGGAKLAPAISPGKTRSGAIGGLAAAILGALLVASCFPWHFSPSHVVTVAAALGILSQSGDLLESGLKRHFGVKDSGRLIPGHGGVLDRLDAVLTVAPAAALLAYSVGQGVVLWR